MAFLPDLLGIIPFSLMAGYRSNATLNKIPITDYPRCVRASGEIRRIARRYIVGFHSVYRAIWWPSRALRPIGQYGASLGTQPRAKLRRISSRLYGSIDGSLAVSPSIPPIGEGRAAVALWGRNCVWYKAGFSPGKGNSAPD